MSRLGSVALMSALLLGAGSGAADAKEGDVETIVTPLALADAEKAEGSQFRTVIDEIVGSPMKLEVRREKLKPVLDFCLSFKDSATLRHASVATAEQRTRLAATQPPGVKLAFVDISCPRAYVTAAFMAIDQDDAADALGWLDRAEALAPYMAWPLTERGFIYNALNRRDEALVAYRKALAVAEANPSESYGKPIALRGIGWTLVEQGNLEGGRKAYQDSLLADPGNKTALTEIAYIDGLEKKGGPMPVSPTRMTAPVDLRQKVISYVRHLEEAPLAEDAKVARVWLIEWEEKTPDVAILICNTMGLLSGKTDREFNAELMVQGMFGNAAWQLEHPEAKGDELAMQVAAVRSTLKAYAAIRRERPQASFPSLDQLARHEAAGDLPAHLAPIVAKECTGK